MRIAAVVSLTVCLALLTITGSLAEPGRHSMQRVQGPYVAPGNKFTEGNPATNVEATDVTADWLNGVQEELCSVVESEGLGLDGANWKQLYYAILYAGQGVLPGISDYADTLVEGSIANRVAAGVKHLVLRPRATPYVIGQDLNIPSDVTVHVMDGAELSWDPATVTVTWDGGLEAGPHRVFADGCVPSGLTKVGRLRPEWFGAVADSNGTTGNGTDCTAALNAAYSLLNTWPNGGKLKLGAGIYRITDSVGILDADKPIITEGENPESTFIYGDFSGPGKGMLDFSFTSDAERISGHGVRSLGFKGNYSKNDPICMLFLNGTGFYIYDIEVFGNGNHRNSALVTNNNNNSDIIQFVAKNGYQPLEGDNAGTTISCASGNTTITASGNAFSAGDVGKYVIIAGAGSEDDPKLFMAEIASYVSATQVVLADAPKTTVSGAYWSYGPIRGSMTAGSSTLTLNHGVLDADDVGRYVTVREVATRAAGGVYTIDRQVSRTGKILSVINSTTCELDFDATNTVNLVQVYFAPVMSFFNDNVSARKNNDVYMQHLQIEGFEGPGVLLEDALAITIDNSKIHGDTLSSTSRSVALSPCCVFASDVGHININTMLTWAGLRLSAQVIIEGAYLPCYIATDEVYGLVDGARVAWAKNTTEDFVLVHGPIRMNHQRASAGSTLLADNPGRLLAAGPITWRDRVPAAYGGVMQQAGYSSSDNPRLSDDTVVSFAPARTRGVLTIISDRANCWGTIWFRTSADDSGAYAQVRGEAGAELGTHGTNGVATLTGTTGADARVNVSVDPSSGQIHIENRAGSSHDLSWHIMY